MTIVDVSEEYINNRYRNCFGYNMHNVYLFESDGFYKIGHTNDVAGRLREEQTGNPHEIRLVTSFTAPFSYCYVFEQTWHKRLSSYHQRGEWFYLTTEILEILMSEMDVRQRLHNAIIRRIHRKARLTVYDLLLVELERPVKY
jgi:hypothetical protein